MGHTLQSVDMMLDCGRRLIILPPRSLNWVGSIVHLILKPWKRGGVEDFSRTKEVEMTAATFDHQVGKSLQFFEQQRNEKTACARFIGAFYFEAR